MAYYINPSMLARHYALLDRLPKELKAAFRLIVVDDGSPEGPAEPPTGKLGFPVSIYRMLQDIRWNQDACRNLAVAKAETDWVLLTDIDHLMPAETLHAAMTGKFDPKRAYNFSRVSEPDLKPYKPHPNSWLMTRKLYDRAGGYDERYAGIYGTDGMFRSRVAEVAKVSKLPEVLIRVPREVTPDASTTRYLRKQPEDVEGKDRVGEEIRASGDFTPHRLTFPWEQVC
jgi:hypothetical protein